MNTILTNHTMSIPNRLAYLLALGFLCVFTMTDSYPEELPVADLKRSEPVNFATEIYPFLKNNCLACHNTTKAKADLILESPATMLTGGDSGPAIEPGKADQSLLFTTSVHREDPTMPPPNNKSKAENLTPVELALLRQWINEGAKGDRVATTAPESWSVLTGPQPIFRSAITDDGRFAAVGRGQKIDLYDLRLGKLISSLTDRDKQHPTAHRDLVQSLAFGPDESLASGGFRVVKIWQRSPAQSSPPVTFSADPVCTDLSASGESLAVGLKDGTIALIDLEADPLNPITFRDHQVQINDLAFSKDEKWIYSVAADGSLNRRSLTETDQSTTLKLPSPGISISTMNNGKQILVGSSDQSIRIFTPDLAPFPGEKPEPFYTHKLEPQPIVAIEPASTDQLEFLVAYENGIVIRTKFDPANPAKAPTEVLRINQGSPLNQVAVSKTRLATAGPTGAVNLWNLADGKKIVALTADPLTPVQVDQRTRESAVATRVKAHWDKKGPESEKLWKDESEKAKKSGEAIAKARRDILAKESALAATEMKLPPAKVEEIDKAKAELKTARQNLTSAIRNRDASSRLAGDALARQSLALAASLEAETLVAALKTEIEELQKASAETVKKLASLQLEFSPDGWILAVAQKEGGLRLWSAEQGTWLEDVPTAITTGQLLFTGNRDIVTSAKDRQLVPWSLPGKTWSLAKALGDGKTANPFPDRISALQFHPGGGKLLTASGVPSRSSEIKVWDTATWTVLSENDEAHNDTITSLAFSPDGSRFVSGSTDKLVKVFKLDTLELQQTFEGHTSHVLDVDWNTSDLTLASSGADLQVKVWDISTVKEKQKVAGFLKEVASVSFVADSDTLLTASGDKSLKVSNQPLPGAGTTFLHTAQVSADGKVIIAAGQDSVLRIWDGKARKLVGEFPSPDAEAAKVATK